MRRVLNEKEETAGWDRAKLMLQIINENLSLLFYFLLILCLALTNFACIPHPQLPITYFISKVCFCIDTLKL